MDIKQVGYQVNNTNATKRRDTLDKNAFLQILASQLSNQDPLNAKDNSEYMAQMAQFTALEQTQNLNVSIEKLLTSQRVTEGSSLIGKSVGFKLSNDSYIKDIVKGVRVEGNSVYLLCESGNYYGIEQVAGVGELQDSSNSGNQSTDNGDNSTEAPNTDGEAAGDVNGSSEN